jgi:transposase
MAWRAVTDQQWELMKEPLPRRKRLTKGGRPPADDRQGFEGILWILWTGAPWSELPARHGAKSTVHRRLSEWAAADVLLNLWRAFLDHLDDRQKVRWDECFIDGMFITAKKGVRWSGRLDAIPKREMPSESFGRHLSLSNCSKQRTIPGSPPLKKPAFIWPPLPLIAQKS